MRGVPRRLVVRWGIFAVLAGLLGQGVLAGWAYLVPRIRVSGAIVDAGAVADYQVGDVRVARDARCYVSRVPEGFLALSWRCTHLGCTLPWRADEPSEDALAAKGRFGCPCHWAKFDRYGGVAEGVATRPLDVYPLTIRGGRIVVTSTLHNAISRLRPRDGIVPLP